MTCLGSKEGFSHMCLALMGPGDTAIVPTPYFPVHVYAVALASANVIQLPVADSDKFLSAVAHTCETLYPKPKVLLLCYPHNPSSAVVEQPFYDEVVKLAKRYNLMVISDFAYADVAFDGYHPPSFLASPGAIDVGVEFTTMSKGYNMAGWRVGFCAGNREMINALGTIKGYYDYGMFQAIQIASIVALRETQAAVEKQSVIYQSRRNALCDALVRLGWGRRSTEGGHVRLAATPRAVAEPHEHDGLRDAALGEGQRRREPRQRLRPRRRGLPADEPGGERGTAPPGGPPDQGVPERGRSGLRAERCVGSLCLIDRVCHKSVRRLTLAPKLHW